MIKILTTKEVSTKIGKSQRRTQELIGTTFPRLEIWKDGKVRLGVEETVLQDYLKSQSKVK